MRSAQQKCVLVTEIERAARNGQVTRRARADIIKRAIGIAQVFRFKQMTRSKQEIESSRADMFELTNRIVRTITCPIRVFVRYRLSVADARISKNLMRIS